MIHLTRRTALTSLIASSVLFTIALAAFCFSLDLDFTNEGWSPTESPGIPSDVGGSRTSQVKWGWMIGSMAGFMVSIVLCFVGLHRIARPDD